jgi:hypothetical protein
VICNGTTKYQIIKHMAIKKSELYSSLWESCDELRGGMDASQYKDYVLVLLFMKYVSDKATSQGLRTRISRLGALGKLGLPLLYSRAGQESNAFCSIDRQDHTTSSGTSAP